MTIQYDNTNTAISAVGSPTNIDINFTSKGTGVIKFNTGGGEQFRVLDTFGGGTATAYWSAYGATSQPRLRAQTASNAWVETSSGNSIVFATNSGVVQQVVSHTASAVNYVQVTGAATGVAATQGPLISAQGSDVDINLRYLSKGAGSHYFSTNTSQIQFRIGHAAGTVVNRLFVIGSIAGAAPSVNSEGSDTNIDLILSPKGTGYVQFGTRTASADAAITGYIEIKDSGGTIRRLAVIG